MTHKLGLVGFVALIGLCCSLLLWPQPAPSIAGSAHRVMLGVIDPDPAAFDRLTSHHHSLHLSFSFASQALLASDAVAGRISVITLQPSGLSSAAIAGGAGDSRLVEQALIVNGFGKEVWIRPMPEMNGHWSPWCSVTASGTSRGAANSAKAFVRAFRRIAIIMRGGTASELNLELSRAGLPPIKAGLLTGNVYPTTTEGSTTTEGATTTEGLGSSEPGIAASGLVKLLWNPQSEGSPNVAGNRSRDYWPGAAYVDLVGDDLYEIRGRASWTQMDAFYKAFPKPFVIAEWAPWGYDSPQFAEKMFAWARSHSRTIGLIYFNRGWSGGNGTFSLQSKPRTLAAYRRAARQATFQSG